MKVGELLLTNSVPGTNPSSRPASTGQEQRKVEGSGDQGSFSEILTDKLKSRDGVRFSAHAVQRLNQRRIMLSSHDLARLQTGVQKVQEKGGKSSLILLDDMAYIISVQNKTVVTTMPTEYTTNKVFTNIDSVAIV